MENGKVLLESNTERHGCAWRVTQYGDEWKYPFLVERIPFDADGTVHEELDDWTCLGGTPGMGCSQYATYEEAKSFYDDVQTLSNEGLLQKHPNLWVN